MYLKTQSSRRTSSWKQAIGREITILTIPFISECFIVYYYYCSIISRLLRCYFTEADHMSKSHVTSTIAFTKLELSFLCKKPYLNARDCWECWECWESRLGNGLCFQGLGFTAISCSLGRLARPRMLSSSSFVFFAWMVIGFPRRDSHFLPLWDWVVRFNLFLPSWWLSYSFLEVFVRLVRDDGGHCLDSPRLVDCSRGWGRAGSGREDHEAAEMSCFAQGCRFPKWRGPLGLSRPRALNWRHMRRASGLGLLALQVWRGWSS